MRRLIAFDCAGETLVGSLDAAEGTTGLLIVSGGNELRMGAHRGMAMLAQRLAATGHPVFRFDRRGIGDSTGSNQGFEASAPDIAAALAAFRDHAPHMTRIVGFGNCDAATALALFQRRLKLNGLVLANPWLGDEPDALPPAAIIRARYAERLRDPRQWLRLLRGGVRLSSIFNGLRKVLRSSSEVSGGLTERLAIALRDTSAPVTVLIAERDNTGLAFAQAWKADRFDSVRNRILWQGRNTASHSFASEDDKAWLTEQVHAALGN